MPRKPPRSGEMLYVSARSSLSNDRRRSKALKFYRAPLGKFGPSHPGVRRIDLKALLRQTKGKRVLCLVHGYANPIQDVSHAFGLIHGFVTERGLYDEVIGFTWPGAHRRVAWGRARRNADVIDLGFASFCEGLNARSLDVITHSLGARVALSGFDELGPGAPLVRNLFVMAAAVPDESLGNGEEFFDASARCERLFVMHSRKDGVLRIAYRVGDAAIALGLDGPAELVACRTHVHTIDCRDVVGEHGDYKKKARLYDFIAHVCNTQKVRRDQRLYRSGRFERA